MKPRPYRPRRRPVEWSSVREATLGDVAAGVDRHKHFVALAALVVGIALFSPGELPVVGDLVGLPEQAPGTTTGAGAVGPDEGSGAVVGGDVAVGGGGVAGPSGEGGPLPGPVDPGPVGFPPPPDGGAGDPGDPGDGGDGGGGGGECRAQPLVDAAEEAQATLEATVGAPFPVRVADLVAVAAGCEQAAASMNDMLLLGRFVPRHDEVLTLALKPLLSGEACGAVEEVAGLQALVVGRAFPALADTVRLCRAVERAEAPEVTPPALEPSWRPPAPPAQAPEAPSSDRANPVSTPGLTVP